jgi:elongation factor Ts
MINLVKDIEKLRELTGAGVIECKKALTEANGDLEKAVAIIYERGLSRAEKRKDKATGAGLLESYIHNGRVGVLLDLRCETDFVARSQDFKELAHNLVMQIAAMAPIDVNELLNQPYIKDDSITVNDLIQRVFAKVGENIKIERFCRYEL